MTARRWARAFAWTIIGSVSANFVFTPLSWRSGWPQIFRQSAITVVFAGSCVALCLAVLPRVSPIARRKLPFPLYWAAILATLVVLAAVGSLLAETMGVLLGLFPASRPLSTWYPNDLKISLYFTVIFGITGTMVQGLRARLSKTTVALRTKERDEAEARRLAAEAQLASLESRVDPHFLFNTLNSIAALVR